MGYATEGKSRNIDVGEVEAYIQSGSSTSIMQDYQRPKGATIYVCT